MAEGNGEPRKSQSVLLQGLHMDLLALTPSELQHWASSLKSTRDIQGGSEFSGIRMRVGGTDFSQTEVLAEEVVPFLSLPHIEPAGGYQI